MGMLRDEKMLWCVRVCLQGSVINCLSAIEPRMVGATPADGLVWEPVDPGEAAQFGFIVPKYIDWSRVEALGWSRASSKLVMKALGWKL